AHAAACFNVLEAEMAKLGLEVRRDKCEYLHRTAPPPTSLIGVARADGALKTLGAFIGDETTSRQLLDALLAKRAAFFERVTLLPSPVGFAVLSKCGVPRMCYATRTHCPAVVGPAAHDFDTKVLSALAAIA